MPDPVSTPPVGTPPTGTPPVGTPPVGTPPAAPWHGYTAPEDVAYVTNKGWTQPQDVVKGYREAERLIGRDPSTLIQLPRADDPAGLRTVFGKLGMPETADKYELDVPQGQQADPEFQTWAKTTFHKLGLTAAQAKEMSAAHNAYVGGLVAKAEADYKTTLATEKAALLTEWKGGHERMMNMAQSAAKALGFDGAMIDAMEQTVGYAKTMKFFAELGKKMGEDSLVLAGDKNAQRFGGAMTPEEATVEWNAKTLDQNFMAALRDKSHPGHAAAQKTQTDLFKIRFPNG